MLPVNEQGYLKTQRPGAAKASSSSLITGLKHLKAGTRGSFVSNKYYQKDHNNRPIKPDANCSIGKLASEQQCLFCQTSAGKPNNRIQKSYKIKELTCVNILSVVCILQLPLWEFKLSRAALEF